MGEQFFDLQMYRMHAQAVYGCYCCFTVPGRKWRNVGCSPSACARIQDCLPPSGSIHDRKKSVYETGGKKKRISPHKVTSVCLSLLLTMQRLALALTPPSS